jgi:hypothetical protein
MRLDLLLLKEKDKRMRQLNKEQGVQECDATEAQQKNKSWAHKEKV